MFATLSDRLAATFKGLRGRGRLSEADVDATVREIRVALLEADVALPVVRTFCATIRERALSSEVSAALNPAQQVVKIVHEELVAVLGGQTRRLRLAKTPPTVVLLAGLQGAGKTTLAGKLAAHLRQQGHTPLLVAADLQRPNAVDQLRVVGERAGVPVFAPEPGNGVGDPVRVAGDGVAQARAKQYDVVLVDTAGRLAIDADLMDQLRRVRDAVVPDEVLLVVDAMVGQDAVVTAQAFGEQVGFDGVVLTKLDGDARGGAALSIVSVTGRPVMYASTGEKLDEFEVFHPDRMASRILDMGDVLSLIEQAERAFDAEQAEQMAAKVARGDDFTLEDFLGQMQAVKKMGSLTKLLGMLPGMGEMRQQLDSLDEREMDRVAAIIQSMTPAERADPKLLNASRRQRIARGSGTEVSDLNRLVERFGEAQKMMRQMRAGGGMPGMPGMPGLPGMGGKKSKGRATRPVKPKKGRSGNPARRAEQERTAPASLGSGAAAFDPAGFDPASFDPAAFDPANGGGAGEQVSLPPALRDLLGKGGGAG
ncbi:MAG: signal recognition particle protein [Actinomycetota bacterium]|nr:MAG: signal recognition particle protein [Actinomycetota bacterium]